MGEHRAEPALMGCTELCRVPTREDCSSQDHLKWPLQSSREAFWVVDPVVILGQLCWAILQLT